LFITPFHAHDLSAIYIQQTRTLIICKKVRENERIKRFGGLVSIKSVPGSEITNRGFDKSSCKNHGKSSWSRVLTTFSHQGLLRFD